MFIPSSAREVTKKSYSCHNFQSYVLQLMHYNVILFTKWCSSQGLWSFFKVGDCKNTENYFSVFILVIILMLMTLHIFAYVQWHCFINALFTMSLNIVLVDNWFMQVHKSNSLPTLSFYQMLFRCPLDWISLKANSETKIKG